MIGVKCKKLHFGIAMLVKGAVQREENDFSGEQNKLFIFERMFFFFGLFHLLRRKVNN